MKVAWVTGASRGIGEAIARQLVAEGYQVALSARGAADLARVAESLAGSLVAPADLAVEEQVARCLAMIEARWGRLDVLVNNAGVAHVAPLAELSIEAWDAMQGANLRAAFLCTRSALPLLRASGGQIVNVGSIAARRVFPGWGGYAAAKAGLAAFSAALGEEERAHGVRVMLLHPGATDSELWARAGLGDMPRERMMTAADVAAAVSFALAQPPRACVSELVLEPAAGAL